MRYRVTFEADVSLSVVQEVAVAREAGLTAAWSQTERWQMINEKLDALFREALLSSGMLDLTGWSTGLSEVKENG